MAKQIQFTLMLNDKNQLAILEHAEGLSNADIQDQLMIIGMLEDVKHKHLEMLNTLFQKAFKKGDI